MKIWTVLEAITKINNDLSLQDEQFVNYDEMSGYFNDAITEAESEIQLSTNGAYDEYFLTSYYIPVVQGTELYALPDNIYANKIRGVDYHNGSLIYPIKRYRRTQKFINQDFTQQYGASDFYRYTLINDNPGQAQMVMRPALRETAILPPSASAFTPITMWYYRVCTRVPMIGEYCNPEVLNNSQFNISTNVITVNSGTRTYGIVSQGQVGGFPGSIAYITGDQVQFKPGPTGALPSGITQGTVYFVIAVTATTIKIATTLANALAGTAVAIGTQGTVFAVMTVAATTAIVNATLLDIPEFTTFLIAHAKVPVAKKEGGVDIEKAEQDRDRIKALMVAALTQGVPDDNDTIEADFSSYVEQS